MDASSLTDRVSDGSFDDSFRLLYGAGENILDFQKKRYIKCIGDFCGMFGGSGELRLLSVPGRSEVGGNHTDHNHGRVLACAVDLDIIAVVRANESGVIRVQSEGFDMDTVSLAEPEPVESERYRSVSLIRGVVSRLKKLGYNVGGGFDAFTTSRVLKGSGLSSSAAFEIMMANIISNLYNGGRIDPVVMAQTGQYAEREYFGKPCGLMDQTACAVGGFITIDFIDTSKPLIEKIEFDFAKTGCTLCIVDTAGSHSDLNDDYASIQREMVQVAKLLGHNFLRDCDESGFYKKLPELRQAVGDRAVLRAIHFFGDNARVLAQTTALKSGDFELFKRLVTESGRSSSMYLQNSYSVKNTGEQGVSLALALAEKLLSGAGAWRVHGGGFAGTIQAFVPKEKLEEFISVMNAVFGENACYALTVRPVGAYALN
jgi:galactokinase